MALYEVAKDYESVEIPKMTIEECRELFCVKNKYKRPYDFKKKVLEVACEDINNNDNIEFAIDYKVFTENGQQYIKFFINKKDKKPKTHKETIIDIEPINKKDEIKSILLLLPPEFRNSKQVVKEVQKYLKSKGKEYVVRNLLYTVKAKPKKFLPYLKMALEKNFSSEQVNTEDIWLIESELKKASKVKIGRKVYNLTADKGVQDNKITLSKDEIVKLILQDKAKIIE